jgi:hypothetical protein
MEWYVWLILPELVIGAIGLVVFLIAAVINGTKS